MSNHTPGPWSVDVGESSGPGMGSDVVRVDVMKGDRRVAGVTVRPGSKALSNARLIAAAPDLLEALSELCDIVHGLIEDGAPHVDSFTLQPARAAIAKATTEAP